MGLTLAVEDEEAEATGAADEDELAADALAFAMGDTF
jgi:hypothetical protein